MGPSECLELSVNVFIGSHSDEEPSFPTLKVVCHKDEKGMLFLTVVAPEECRPFGDSRMPVNEWAVVNSDHFDVSTIVETSKLPGSRVERRRPLGKVRIAP